MPNSRAPSVALLPCTTMRSGLLVLGIAAIAVFVGALVMLEARQSAQSHTVADPEQVPPSDAPPKPEPSQTPRSPRPRSDPKTPTPPPGFRLGKSSGPNARANAQAILDNALAELRRLDGSQQALARDVYMRGHSAAERVEDELGPDDEPGLAKLRAHEDAMKAELRRIYGAEGTKGRP